MAGHVCVRGAYQLNDYTRTHCICIVFITDSQCIHNDCKTPLFLLCLPLSFGFWARSEEAYHASLSRRRSPVRIRSGPPQLLTHRLFDVILCAVSTPDDFEREHGHEFTEPSEQSLVIPERHQAVFLKDESCYFGKLWVYPNLYVISDVYYINSEDTTKLIWLQDSYHNPENVMHIPRENVRFWENLREDGSVALGIQRHKESLG